MIHKTGYFNANKVDYFEDEETGTYSYIDGEWIFCHKAAISHSE
jgi:hypothetical protein